MVSPLVDPVMGSLSSTAQYIVLALRDSGTRVSVMRALKANNPALAGLDLRSCKSDPIIQRLFASGERHGGTGAAVMCQSVLDRSDLTLYMDRDRLRAWDGTTIPIVTAIANPDQTLPAKFRGYRSASRSIDLSRDSTVGGPLLVVLPVLHPNAYRARANDNATVVARPLGIPRTSPRPNRSVPDGQR